MTMDRSLKVGGSLSAHRNILTRAERIAKLTEKGKFDAAANSPLGLPKVANRKAAVAAKPKKEAAAAGTPVAGAPGVAGAAPAPAAAAPAKGAGKGAGKK